VHQLQHRKVTAIGLQILLINTRPLHGVLVGTYTELICAALQDTGLDLPESDLAETT